MIQCVLRKPLVLLALFAALSGCGGGGSGSTAADAGVSAGTTTSAGTGAAGGDEGGSQPSVVTFSPSALAAAQKQGFSEDLTATVSIQPLPQRPTPSSTLFIFIVAAEPVFDTGQITLHAVGPSSATGSLPIRQDLAVGTYTGTLTLRACWDASCSNELALTGNRVGYTITVVPQVELSATGPLTVFMQNPITGKPTSYLVNSGATVVITSNIPVTWLTFTGFGGSELAVVSSTPTRLEAKVIGISQGFPGVFAKAIQASLKNLNAAQLLFEIQ